ncbi:hypothetical protein [Aminobacter sp. LjRoot7]|uniref:hypothetical protein n=1 Tax=Aminobacter sp. LjRoot7 TaxID=3342335 RepID=UPI003F4F9E53
MDLPGRELFANVAISNPLEDLQSAIDRAAWEVSVFGGTHEVIETTNDSLFDSFVVHLERLRNGWAGPQSIAPSKEIVRDISLAAVSMEKVLVAPDIEVDEDGTVVFEWKNGGRSFCLTFTGNGTVVGTISPWNAAEPPWRANVKDEIAIAEKLETESISAFIGR